MGKFKELLEGEYVLPAFRKINEPHSVVTINYKGKLFACRVWPWTDCVTQMVGLEDFVESFIEMNDYDKIALVVLLSDLSLEDMEYISEQDFVDVYNEIVAITNQGGH